jgi:signal transduction histidine kinase
MRRDEASTNEEAPLRIPQPGRFRRYADGHPRLMNCLVAGSYGLIYLFELAVAVGDPPLFAAARATAHQPVVAPLVGSEATLAIWRLVVEGLVGCVLLVVWRRSQPVRLAAVALAADAVSAALFGTVNSVLPIYSLFAVAQRAGPKAIWIWGGAWLAESYLGSWLFSGEARGPVDASLILGATASALLVTVFAQVGSRRRYVAALVETARALALERDQRAQIAVGRERERISREMHDVVAHSVAVMVTLSDAAQAAFDKDPAKARQAMEQVSNTGRQAVSDMRRLLTILRSDVELGPQPGAADLVPLVGSFGQSGMPVRLETSAALPDDPSLGLALYRIVQESLTNVLRHAPDAAWVKVTVGQAEPGLIEVTVENGPQPPGRAVRPWHGSGQGIVGMRQRVEVFGGRLEAAPTPSGGWLVRATLKEER